MVIFYGHTKTIEVGCAIASRTFLGMVCQSELLLLRMVRREKRSILTDPHLGFQVQAFFLICTLITFPPLRCYPLASCSPSRGLFHSFPLSSLSFLFQTPTLLPFGRHLPSHLWPCFSLSRVISRNQTAFTHLPEASLCTFPPALPGSGQGSHR